MYRVMLVEDDGAVRHGYRKMKACVWGTGLYYEASGRKGA